MRAFVAGASAARHAGALARPVRCGVGQLDAVTASQTTTTLPASAVEAHRMVAAQDAADR